jgi:hypothetical protein
MNHTKNIYGIISDIGYVIIIPTISTFGFTFNFLSVLVLTNKIFKETMYKYLLANSLIDALYLFIIAFLPIARCFDMCNLSSQRLPKLYELYAFLFSTHVLSTVSTLTSVSVALDRYLSVSKINRCKWKFNIKLMLGFYFIFAVLNQLPTIIAFKVVEDLKNTTWDAIQFHNHDHNRSHFILGPTKFGESKEAKLLIIVLQVNINLTPTTLIIIVNILLLLKLRRQALVSKQLQQNNFFMIYSKQICSLVNSSTVSSDISNIEFNRNKRTSDMRTKVEQNVTSMIIFISIVYVFGRFANTISAILFLFFNNKSEIHRLVILLCNIIEFSTYGMNIFIFYAFNKNFARTCDCYLAVLKRYLRFGY